MKGQLFYTLLPTTGASFKGSASALHSNLWNQLHQTFRLNLYLKNAAFQDVARIKCLVILFSFPSRMFISHLPAFSLSVYSVCDTKLWDIFKLMSWQKSASVANLSFSLLGDKNTYVKWIYWSWTAVNYTATDIHLWMGAARERKVGLRLRRALHRHQCQKSGKCYKPASGPKWQVCHKGEEQSWGVGFFSLYVDQCQKDMTVCNIICTVFNLSNVRIRKHVQKYKTWQRKCASETGIRHADVNEAFRVVYWGWCDEYDKSSFFQKDQATDGLSLSLRLQSNNADRRPKKRREKKEAKHCRLVCCYGTGRKTRVGARWSLWRREETDRDIQKNNFLILGVNLCEFICISVSMCVTDESLGNWITGWCVWGFAVTVKKTAFTTKKSGQWTLKAGL